MENIKADIQELFLPRFVIPLSHTATCSFLNIFATVDLLIPNALPIVP